MRRINAVKAGEKNKPEKIKEKFNLKESIFPLACLTPSFIGVLIFFIIPFLVVIYYSVLDNPMSRNFVGLDNFIAVIKNSAFRKAAANTFKFSLFSVPLAVVLSMGLAMLLDSKIPFVSQFRTCFLCPMMVPVASVVLIWQVIFHYNGTLNEVVTTLGGGRIDWLKSNEAMVVIVLLFLWKNLGYNMILFLSAIGNIPNDLIEVATLEGASGWYKFLHIKLRYLSPTILFVGILSLINSFKVFREVYLLTGDYPYDSLYLLQHFMNNTFRTLDYQKLSSAALLMAIVITAIIAALFIVENHFGKDVE